MKLLNYIVEKVKAFFAPEDESNSWVCPPDCAVCAENEAEVNGYEERGVPVKVDRQKRAKRKKTSTRKTTRKKATGTAKRKTNRPVKKTAKRKVTRR